MRIAQIMAGAHLGGAELFFERLSIALHRAGEEVLPLVRYDSERAKRLAAAGMVPVQLRFGGPLDFVTRPRLARLLRRFAPRVAVSWMSRATQHTPRGSFVHIARLGGYYPLRHYRHCHHLIGNTQGLVAWFRANGWPAERTHWLPNFVADYRESEPASDLAPGQPLLLALGRLHRDKGFDLLIQALAQLPGARLAIAGEGPERANLARLAAEADVADRVTFLGWRTDVGALLKAADIFVCPSRSEPLGNVVLEAWSAGAAVLAAAAEGPAELIRHGVDGVLVPLEDARGLAEAAAALLTAPDRRQSLARAGRERFLAEFAEAPVVAAWQHFFATVER